MDRELELRVRRRQLARAFRDSELELDARRTRFFLGAAARGDVANDPADHRPALGVEPLRGRVDVDVEDSPRRPELQLELGQRHVREL